MLGSAGTLYVRTLSGSLGVYHIHLWIFNEKASVVCPTIAHRDAHVGTFGNVASAFVLEYFGGAFAASFVVVEGDTFESMSLLAPVPTNVVAHGVEMETALACDLGPRVIPFARNEVAGAVFGIERTDPSVVGSLLEGVGGGAVRYCEVGVGGLEAVARVRKSECQSASAQDREEDAGMHY